MFSVKEGCLQLHSVQCPNKAQRNAECLVQKKGGIDPALRRYQQHKTVLRCSEDHVWYTDHMIVPTVKC